MQWDDDDPNHAEDADENEDGGASAWVRLMALELCNEGNVKRVHPFRLPLSLLLPIPDLFPDPYFDDLCEQRRSLPVSDVPNTSGWISKGIDRVLVWNNHVMSDRAQHDRQGSNVIFRERRSETTVVKPMWGLRVRLRVTEGERSSIIIIIIIISCFAAKWWNVLRAFGASRFT